MEENGKKRGNNTVLPESLRLRIDGHFEVAVLYCARGADPTNTQAGTSLQCSAPGSIYAFPYLETKIDECHLKFQCLCFSSEMWNLGHGVDCFSQRMLNVQYFDVLSFTAFYFADLVLIPDDCIIGKKYLQF